MTSGVTSSSSLTPAAARTKPQHYSQGNNPRHSLTSSHSYQARQTPSPVALLETPTSSQHNRSNHSGHRYDNHSSHGFGSPFMSPSIPTSSSIRRAPQRRRIQPEPLVLDPTGSTNNGSCSKHQSFDAATSSQSRASLPVVHKFFGAATRGIATANASPAAISPSPHRSPFYSLEQSASQIPGTESVTTALDMSRTAPQAGFLQKMGANIPEFKRRFFVLCPSTRLYYYLSPHDTQPRGFVELDGSARIEEVEHLLDGRFRFSISWSEKDSTVGKTHEERKEKHRKIILEARSKEIGQQWMQNMDTERLSTQKSRADTLASENAAYQAKVKDLERQVENFKMVEQDRDGALDDARKWKEQFERLDEAIRLLTQQIRRPPISPTGGTAEAAEHNPEDGENKKICNKHHWHNGDQDELDSKGEEKKDVTLGEAEEQNPSSPPNNEVGNAATSIPSEQPTQRDSALLDSTVEDDDQGQDIGDLFHVPGTYFAALSNACQQQRQSLRLAATEASKAVEDLQENQTKLSAMDKRMEKAEKHLCKLWEENCQIRKSLKQKKREKRVLVREVKALQHQLANEKEEIERKLRVQLTEQQQYWERSNLTGVVAIKSHETKAQTQASDPREDAEASMMASEDERLLTELEEHVASTIKLHERLLIASGEPPKSTQKRDDAFSNPSAGGDADGAMDTSIDSIDVTTRDRDGSRRVNVALNRFSGTLKLEQNSRGSDSAKSGRLSPLQPKLLSLFDHDDSEDDDEEDNDQDNPESVSRQNERDNHSAGAQSVICSVSAEIGDSTDDSSRRGLRTSLKQENDLLKNPLLHLDDEDESKHDRTAERAQSTITDNGQATSRLICPLADVVEINNDTLGSSAPAESSAEVQVYHLTFYTQKIGIQFQKAPVAPVRPKGLLTDAMTADLTGERNGSGKTASELRGIATISELARSGGSHNDQKHKKGDEKDDLYCPVATPKDAVLVCGFAGFEESGNNVRPKLGARLVAFDGISVEIGKWTFDSIRKAIKARGRPLTLSFRDDFLTTEQRAILTKAVSDVEAATLKQVPIRQLVQRPGAVRHTRAPSITSVLSHESDQFINDGRSYPPAYIGVRPEEDDMSTSVASSDYVQSRRGFSSSNNSASTNQGSTRDFYSFSEAGTSSVVSSAFAPLMANLLNGISERQNVKETPGYLRRNESLEDTPQHREFESNLL